MRAAAVARRPHDSLKGRAMYYFALWPTSEGNERLMVRLFQSCQIWALNESDWPEMGQFRDFFFQTRFHYILARRGETKCYEIWSEKSPGIVPFWANLTHLGHIWHPSSKQMTTRTNASRSPAKNGRVQPTHYSHSCELCWSVIRLANHYNGTA